jgi:hypothetical protein
MALKTLNAGLCMVAVATAVAGCSDQQAATLDSAFKQDIHSADVSIAVTWKSDDGQPPTAVTLGGPFQSNGNGKLPSLDWTMNFKGPDASSSGELRVITTERNAFVVVKGETYEVGEKTIAQAMQQRGKAQQPSLGDFTAAAGNFRRWLHDTGVNESANLDGEPVTRFSGQLDVVAALEGIKQLAGSKVLNPQQQALIGALDDKTIANIGKMVKDPKFQVDVAKSDGKLRRVFGEIQIQDEKGLHGFSVEVQFKNVDKPVTINAPKSGRPIKEIGPALKSLD